MNPQLRQWEFEPPAEWTRLSSIRRQIWKRRSRELYLESRKARHLPIEVLHPNRAAAEAAAFAILDAQPLLVGRFRSSGELLHLALLTQGYELLAHSRANENRLSTRRGAEAVRESRRRRDGVDTARGDFGR